MQARRATLITIEQKTAERNDVERIPEQWEERTKVWCEVETAAGGESVEGGQQVAERPLVLKTHWTPAAAAIAADMRAKLPGGKELGIKSVVNTNLENRELVITCVERN